MQEGGGVGGGSGSGGSDSPDHYEHMARARTAQAAARREREKQEATADGGSNNSSSLFSNSNSHAGKLKRAQSMRNTGRGSVANLIAMQHLEDTKNLGKAGMGLGMHTMDFLGADGSSGSSGIDGIDSGADTGGAGAGAMTVDDHCIAMSVLWRYIDATYLGPRTNKATLHSDVEQVSE
jgi:hypothetical protein